MMLKLRATAIGALVTLIGFAVRIQRGDLGDFWWALREAADIWFGRNPYGFVPSDLMVPYPLPVIAFGFPLIWFNWSVASALFFGLATGLLAYGALRAKEGWRLVVLLSYPYAYALTFAQWSPLIMAAWYLPFLAPLLVLIKPQIAAPVVLAKGVSKAGALIAATILLATLILVPFWPIVWLGMVGQYARVIPALVFPPLLLVALRWRDPRARLLLGMVLLPYRAMYDLTCLWLVVKRPWQACFLALLSWPLSLLPWQDAARWSVVVLFIPAALSLLPQLYHRKDLFRRGKPAIHPDA